MDLFHPHDSEQPFDGQEPDRYDDEGRPVGDFTEAQENCPVSLRGLRDLIDAVTPEIEANATPMVRLYAGELAHALDELGVGR